MFAQVDIQVSEKLNALLGVSYIEDEKEVSYNQINTAVFSNLDFVGAGTMGPLFLHQQNQDLKKLLY